MSMNVALLSQAKNSSWTSEILEALPKVSSLKNQNPGKLPEMHIYTDNTMILTNWIGHVLILEVRYMGKIDIICHQYL